VGYGYIHSAVDEHSRLAYSEILPDERKETAAGFWQRARSRHFDEFLGQIKHRKSKPHRPQTNGKIGRNRTMLKVWAYVKPNASEAERREPSTSSCISTIITAATRPIGSKTPIGRVDSLARYYS
jgi:hypothetical protein